MSEQEVNSLLNDQDGELLRNLITCEPEIENIQKLVNVYIAEVENLSKSNSEAKETLGNLIEKYEEKVTEFNSL